MCSDCSRFTIRCPRCMEIMLSGEDGWVCSDTQCGCFVRYETLAQTEVRKTGEKD